MKNVTLIITILCAWAALSADEADGETPDLPLPGIAVDTVVIDTTPVDTAIPVNTASIDTTASVDTTTIDTTASALFGIPVPYTFSLHSKQSVKTIDSLIPPALAGLSLTPSAGDGSNLSVSGYKSFGVSVGELGEVNLEQGLEVTVEGEIRPGTALSAYLSDEGSTLDGSTREISEFDMVNATLTNANFKIVAGDQFAARPDGGMLSGRKKIVGISADVTPKGGPISVNAFGSFSGGNRTTQTFRGREGVQGPYYLTGQGEANIITPVSGTVKAQVNGKDLTEGREEDFTVDYDIGAVTFNPRVLIRQDDFIRIEYEYKSFDYRRTFAGGGASYRYKDSVFTIRGHLWSESDDKNNPIETQLGAAELSALRNSGGATTPVALSARPVHPNDVASMSVYHPLYKKSADAATGDTILVYTPYDPTRPGDIHGFYTAWFTPAQTGTAGADYTVDTTVARGQFVYRYAGAGLGDHTALAPIVAPMRETSGEIEARLRMKHLKASLNIVGKETDNNLFSSIDDGDNLSSAMIFKLSAGEKRLDRRSLWATFDYRFRSRIFTDEIVSASDRKTEWDIDAGPDAADATAGRQFQSWEASAGGTVVKGAAIRAGGGQTFVDSLTETEKITTAAEFKFMRDILGAEIGGAFFRHHLSDIDVSHRRYAKFSVKPSKSWEGLARYDDEWRVDTAGQGRGHVSGTAEFKYAPANLRQNISAAKHKRGGNFLESIDTGYTVTWEQSVAWEPLKTWKLTGDSRLRQVKVSGQNTASTFLASAVSEIGPTGHGLSSRQEYRVNRELASRFEQKMFYIGKGLGTHAFDTTLGEFRPAANGDHIIQEIEIFDNVSGAAVRKTMFNGDWHFKPAKKIRGILNDLTWSGILSIEEHIDARNGAWETYIPGYLSLFPGGGGDNGRGADNPYYDDTNQNDPYSPHYTDISYRQDIDYHIKKSLYKSRLTVIPGLRIVRGYRENFFETAIRTERKKDPLTLTVEPKYFSISRKNQASTGGASGVTSGEYDYRDISVEFTQSRRFRNIFEFYVRERAGRIFDNDQNRAAAVPADSAVYFQIRPGITCRPAKGGVAELSYTFSYVPYGGEMDYRMAGGFSAGTSHVITLYGDIRMGGHFSLSGVYRGEQIKRLGARRYEPASHVFSLTVKAFL